VVEQLLSRASCAGGKERTGWEGRRARVVCGCVLWSKKRRKERQDRAAARRGWAKQQRTAASTQGPRLGASERADGRRQAASSERLAGGLEESLVKGGRRHGEGVGVGAGVGLGLGLSGTPVGAGTWTDRHTQTKWTGGRQAEGSGGRREGRRAGASRIVYSLPRQRRRIRRLRAPRQPWDRHLKACLLDVRCSASLAPWVPWCPDSLAPRALSSQEYLGCPSHNWGGAQQQPASSVCTVRPPLAGAAASLSCTASVPSAAAAAAAAATAIMVVVVVAAVAVAVAIATLELAASSHLPLPPPLPLPSLPLSLFLSPSRLPAPSSTAIFP